LEGIDEEGVMNDSTLWRKMRSIANVDISIIGSILGSPEELGLCGSSDFIVLFVFLCVQDDVDWVNS
jgi:hypothetical protein